MLNIIYSPYGCGKTTMLIEQLAADIEQGKRPCLIVPEQFHFETERKLYRLLGPQKIASAEITSFSKLSERICKHFGIQKPYSDDIVKQVTMLRAVSMVESELTFYHKKARTKTFAANMLSLVSQLKREGITAEMLDFSEKGRLPQKLQDIRRIYTCFDRLLSENYSDKLDDTLHAAEIAFDERLFYSGRVYLDGFDGFSGSQQKLIRAIMHSAESVTVAITTDTYPSSDSRYLSQNKLVATLIRYATKMERQYKLTPATRFPERAPKAAELMNASDVYTECDWIAARICELVRENGYQQNEIAVLSRNASAVPVLLSSLRKYDITAFADIPSPIVEKPMIAFLLQILKAATFEGEHILSYLRSGFVRVPAEYEKNAAAFRQKRLKYRKHDTSGRSYAFLDAKTRSVRMGRRTINELSAAAKTMGIKGSDWQKSFPESGKYAYLEPVRARLITDLTAFADKTRDTTGDMITEALADFVVNKVELGRTMLAIVNQRTSAYKKGFDIDKSLSDEYRQLWDTMVNVWESMHSALLDYPITLADYTDMLKRVLQSTNIARPPQVIDAVTVGDIERTRTDGIKIAFLMGTQNGILPQSTKVSGEFDADELEELVGMGIELSDDRKGRFYRERFVVGKALATPTERLIVTASRNSVSWTATEISPLFSELGAKYGSEIILSEKLSPVYFAKTKASLRQYAALFPKDEALKAMLWQYDPHFAAKLYRTAEPTGIINKDIATKLLTRLAESPSSIKTLSTCRFQYFCKYGLSIYPLSTENNDEPDALVRGNLVHFCMEEVTKDFPRFLSMDSVSLAVAVNDSIDKFISELPYKDYTSKESVYLLRKHAGGIVRLLGYIQTDFENSSFAIGQTEKQFAYTLDGVRIKGRIDRMDIAKTEDGMAVNVVDYKSGGDKFDFNKVYYGLDLQILLYLFGVEEMGVPTGAFLSSSNTGRLSKTTVSDHLTPTEQEKNKHWLTSHRQGGVQLDDPVAVADVAARQSRYNNLTGSTRTQYIQPTRLDKEGYNTLKSYIGQQLSSRLSSVREGDISAVPLKEEGQNTPDSCKYCDYKGLCGNDGSDYVLIEKGMIDTIFRDKGD